MGCFSSKLFISILFLTGADAWDPFSFELAPHWISMQRKNVLGIQTFKIFLTQFFDEESRKCNIHQSGGLGRLREIGLPRNSEIGSAIWCKYGKY